MERLLQLAGNPALTQAADRPMLDEWIVRYPWFILPKLLLLRLAERQDDAETATRMRNELILRLSYYPAPESLLDSPDWTALSRKAGRELIEDFLAVEDKRIVPEKKGAGFPENDLSAVPEGAEADGPVSERLAEIYAAQELNDRAAAIYRRLSLKFPEKSVYFADRIEQLKRNK